MKNNHRYYDFHKENTPSHSNQEKLSSKLDHNSMVGVIFITLVSMLVGFSLLYVVNDWYLSDHDWEKIWNPILQKDFNESGKKIYLLGNSRVQRLNETFIEKSVNDAGYDSKVYNLGVPTTQPSDRLLVLDKIILTKPEFVLIGIDPTDFQPWKVPSNQIKSNNLFLDPHEFFESLKIEKYFGIDSYNFKNPKFTTLQIIDNFLKQNDDNLIPRPGESTYIATDEEMKNFVKNNPFGGTILIHNNNNLDALEQIISELQDKNIHVAIFVTPRPDVYLQTIPDKEKEIFFDILANLSKKYDIKIYSLFEKYNQLPIWTDETHLTMSPKGLVYSKDVSKIILEEIK